LEADQELNQWVKACMDQYWSPEIITAIWKKKHPTTKLSHSTIYASLKKGRIEGYTPKTHLRRRGRRKNTHQSATIHPERLIRDWPKKIKDRIRIGDWEGDTVYGAIGKGLIVTCVDRKTRFLATTLLEKRTRELTRQSLRKALQGLPVHSLSLDNGAEFADFKDIEKDLRTKVYFADRHAPWQRGSNENVNELIRFFFPKGTNFHKVTEVKLAQVTDLINHRPRKCLGWLSPAQALSMCCT
jgi:IS30 family transposase